MVFQVYIYIYLFICFHLSKCHAISWENWQRGRYFLLKKMRFFRLQSFSLSTMCRIQSHRRCSTWPMWLEQRIKLLEFEPKWLRFIVVRHVLGERMNFKGFSVRLQDGKTCGNFCPNPLDNILWCNPMKYDAACWSRVPYEIRHESYARKSLDLARQNNFDLYEAEIY